MAGGDEGGIGYPGYFSEYPTGRNFYDLWEIATGEIRGLRSEVGIVVEEEGLPQMTDLDFPELVGTRVTSEGYNMSPRRFMTRWGPTPSQECFIRPTCSVTRDSTVRISAPGPDHASGREMGESFESIHVFRNRIGTWREQAVFSIKRGSGDRLIIYDLRTEEIVRGEGVSGATVSEIPPGIAPESG